MIRNLHHDDIARLTKSFAYQVPDPNVKRRTDYISYDTFLEVAEWKSRRPRNRYPLNKGYVEDVTGLALRQQSERRKISLLCTMDGVKAPIASALLHFAVSEHYPIIDFRAVWTLWNVTGQYNCDERQWEKYVVDCRKYANFYGVSVRELDKALWQYSYENQRATIEEI